MLEYRQNNIQVIVRVKPESGCVTVDECDSTAASISGKQFHFDHVIPPQASQQDVFTLIGQPLINNALQGYNGCVFAYGQTGSGKTYTLIGNNDGLLPQSLQYIFACSIDDSNAVIKGSFLEIYNEHIYDLLSSTPSTLQIREDPKKGTYVENLSAVETSNYEEAMALLKKGNQNRHIAATKMNNESSRSHAVFLIQYSTSIQQENCDIHLSSKMYFVDLAGSERQKTAQTEGQRFKETQAINKSLTQLGLVIYAIVERENGNSKIHIPFRDSKLTTLLRDSLGGNSKTFMVAAINPLHQEESFSTLKFAERVKQIKVKAHVNKEYSGEEIARLNLQIQQLKDEISRKNKELENVQPSDALQSQLRKQFEEIQMLLNLIHQSATEMQFEEVEGQLQEFSEKKSFIIKVLKSLNMQFQEESDQNLQTISIDIEIQNKLKIQLLQQEDVIYKLQKKKKELEQNIVDQQSAHKTIISSIQRGFEEQIKMKDYLYDQLREDSDQMEVAKLTLQHQFDCLNEKAQELSEKLQQIEMQNYQLEQHSSTIQEEKAAENQNLEQELNKQIEFNQQLRSQLELINQEIFENNQLFQEETKHQVQVNQQQILEINRLQERIQRLENENKVLKNSHDYKLEYDQITSQYSILKNQLQQLEQDFQSQQTENQYLKSVNDNLETTIKSFELFEDNWKSENNLYRNTIIELQGQINQKQEAFSEIQKSFKIENNDNIVSALKSKLKVINRNELKTRQELQQMKSEQQLFAQKMQVKDQTIIELQSELLDIKKVHKNCETQKQVESNEAQQNQRQLEQKVATLKMEYDRVSKSKIALLVEYTNIEKAKKDQEQFLQQMEKKLQDYIQNNYRKNRAMTNEQQMLYIKTTQIKQSKFIIIESLMDIVIVNNIILFQLDTIDRQMKNISQMKMSY